jgi:hypothetical protein
MAQVLIVEPIGKLAHIGQLVDALVQAEPFDDVVFRHQRYVGTIDEVKINRMGTFVHFKTDQLVGKKWIPLHKVQGFAHYEESDIVKAMTA